MFYLTQPEEIRKAIASLKTAKILWMDTEVADWYTANPRLSLIQVLTDPNDRKGEGVYLLDVLDKPDLVLEFISQIMASSDIVKVFHSATYDLKLLGKDLAKNITCTLKLANKVHLNTLGTPNRKLKTLAAKLCNFENVDTEEQTSDWGQRPLTVKQLDYAKMDVVYLACVHRHLLKLTNQDTLAFWENKTMALSQQEQYPSFSATKVRVAFECPRLFYLNYHFNGNTLFLPPEHSKGIGTTFHKLADNFLRIAKQDPRFQNLFAYPPEELKAEEIASKMQQLAYELVFFPFLEKVNQQDDNQASVLYQLWQGLIRLIHHWSKLLIKNRYYCNADEVITRTLIDGELGLEYQFTLANGTQQRVSGKLDSLIYDLEKKRFCVVEFKTYEPVDASAQLAQVALYSYMLWADQKVPVDSAVYCVIPEFKEYYYSWEQLENTVHQLTPYKLQQMREWIAWEPPQLNPPPVTTQPHLCRICPQQEKCQTYFDENYKPSEVAEFPPAINPPTKSNPSLKVPKLDADPIGTELLEILKSFKIEADYLGAIVAPSFIRVKVKPSPGFKVSSLKRLSDDLQVQLGIVAAPLMTTQAGYVSIDLPRTDREIACFEDYIQSNQNKVKATVKVALGVDLEGKLIKADLSDPNTCHLLVGGTTGSGKSEFLRSLLLSLLYRHTPQQIKIALVDPKRVTFPEFEKMPWLWSPVVKDSENAIALMMDLVTEMERRYRLLEAAKCSHLTAYNQTHPPLPPIVCIFDEYADFMADKDTRTHLEQSIKRLGAMARAAGIHLIIATQRPEANVVTPIIRSNLPGRVALRTASEADSMIILGGKQIEAAYLLGKGDLLYQVGSQLQRLQSLFAKTIQFPE